MGRMHEPKRLSGPCGLCAKLQARVLVEALERIRHDRARQQEFLMPVTLLLRFDDLAEVPIRPAGHGNLWIGPSFLVSGSALEPRRRIARRIRDLADHLSD